MVYLLAIGVVAILWSVLAGELTIANLAIGGLLGLLLLSVIDRGEEHSFTRRLGSVLRFFVRFLFELFAANVTIALLAVRPSPRFHPHVIAVELRLQSDAALSLLSATITLLPGTVAMGFSPDRKFLYAHAMGAEPETARRGVRRIEELILGFMT
jgi:multicomponent Na+:H+ antiporter subunit E